MKKENINNVALKGFCSGHQPYKNDKVLSNNTSGRHKWERAFTLIELLVVVLIIGILAAVAVPQYQVAVAKARYMQLVSLANALYKGQALYRLANGHSSGDIRELAIDLPAGTSYNSTGDTIYYSWGHCMIGTTGYAFCESTRDGVRYSDLSGVGIRQCEVKVGASTETLARQICKSFGGKPNSTADANGWLHYELP